MEQRLLAQLTNPVIPSTIGSGGAGGNALGNIISGMVGALFIAGFLLALVFLITGAISWISSGGDKAKLEKARDQIINAMVGLVIVGSAWAVGTLAAGFFGLNLESLPIPTINKSAVPGVYRNSNTVPRTAPAGKSVPN